MDITSLYWTCYGKNFNQLAEHLEKVRDVCVDNLVDLIINTHYNNFIDRYASFNENEDVFDSSIKNGKVHGKRIPYIGWYWRNTDFANKIIRIGNCGDFIGVMEKNKWDYPERRLTENECDQVIEIIDEAMKKNQAGGELGSIRNQTVEVLEELWLLFQTFTI